MAPRNRLVFGCGYLGGRVARRWVQAGDEVFAVTRSAERSVELRAAGIVPLVADVTEAGSLDGLRSAETVLFAVGYDRSSSRSIEEVYAGGVRNVLSALAKARQDSRRFVYVSTTGVYGDAAGKWVDEGTPPAPAREGARASLAAEEALCGSHLASRAVVLRMGGLYGPGRVPFLDKLRAGEPIPAPQQGWLNLIHVDDAAAAVLAAAEGAFNGLPGPHVVNVVDDEPVERGEYYGEVARLIGADPPRFAPPDPASHRAVRAGTNRRISNARLHSMLDVTLSYPNYRAGLKSILTGPPTLGGGAAG